MQANSPLAAGGVRPCSLSSAFVDAIQNVQVAGGVCRRPRRIIEREARRASQRGRQNSAAAAKAAWHFPNTRYSCPEARELCLKIKPKYYKRFTDEQLETNSGLKWEPCFQNRGARVGE